MLVLGRNKQISEDFIVIDPVGIIKDDTIEVLDNTKKNIKFPNQGRIHTPKRLQELTKGNYGVYELTISNLYKENEYKSHYYEVKRRYQNMNLYEVIKINYNFDSDKEQIVKRIRTGFFSDEEPLPRVIIETSDKYLLGPFIVEYSIKEQKFYIANNFEFEKYFINTYNNSSNQLSTASVIEQNNKVRHFTLEPPNENDFITELDIASEDYIIREALNLLRGQQEYEDITRRIYSDINNWLNDITFSEEVNINRLGRTIRALDQIMPNEIYKDLSNQLMDLPVVKNIINDAIAERYENDYEEFLKIHDQLIRKIAKLKNKNKELLNQNAYQEETLEKAKNQFSKYVEYMNNKKVKLEQEILNQYFNNLLQNNLNLNATLNNKGHESQKIIEEYNDEFQDIDDLKNLRSLFRNNLSIYSERDVRNKILDYCLLSIKFKTPMFIVGEASYILANIIKNTFAAKFSKKILFDNPNFSFRDILNNYVESEDELSFTIIPNIQNSQSSLNLLPFIQQLGRTNSQLIFTFDSIKESDYVLQQLINYPILNVEDQSFTPSPFAENKAIEKGQFKLKSLLEIGKKYDFDESLDILLDEFDILEAEELVERKLKYKYKNIVYANQFLGEPTTVLEYFPFIVKELKEKAENYATYY